jgi:hypothetical protein
VFVNIEGKIIAPESDYRKCSEWMEGLKGLDQMHFAL